MSISLAVLEFLQGDKQRDVATLVDTFLEIFHSENARMFFIHLECSGKRVR
jgi:hypothetical protein